MINTKKLSEELYSINDLSQRDIEQIHTLIIDYFAAAYAGKRHNQLFNKAVENAVLYQGGVAESSVLFQKTQYPARVAAFINSVYGHGAELDDGNKKAAGHAGVHIIPSVFALAEKLGSSNNDVLVAVATGYEAYIRISSAAQPGMISRGFHSTGMAGTLACAASCARLFHLSAKGVEDSIALATTMSGGLLSYGDSRPEIKPLNPGKAAENGLFAALLVKEGIEGPIESLEGSNGWFNAVTDEVHEECLCGTDHLLLHDCYFKLYPSCRHTHCGIDAAIQLHDLIDTSDIQEINVYIYPNAIKLANIKMPKTSDETKFSITYTLACALENGSYGICDMNPENINSNVKKLMNKINIHSDSSMENKEKGIRGARVEVIMNGGMRREEVVLAPKGDPENPLKKQDIINKLINCSTGLASGKTIDNLVSSIESIEGNGAFINPIRIIGESL